MEKALHLLVTHLAGAGFDAFPSSRLCFALWEGGASHGAFFFFMLHLCKILKYRPHLLRLVTLGDDLGFLWVPFHIAGTAVCLSRDVPSLLCHFVGVSFSICFFEKNHWGVKVRKKRPTFIYIYNRPYISQL